MNIGQKTAYTMVKAGDLPGFKLRGQWRFRRVDVDAWIERQLKEAASEHDGGSG